MKRPMVFEGVVAVLIIVLLFAMYLMVSGGLGRAGSWEVKVDQPVWDIYAGDDGTLYAFTGPTGNTIDALDEHGDPKWKLRVPDQWRVANQFEIRHIPSPGGPQVVYGGFSSIVKPVYAAENGILYVYLRENRTTMFNHYPWETDWPYQSYENDTDIEERLLAISNGRVLWNVSVGDHFLSPSAVKINVENGRIYAFTSYSLTLLDDSGKLIRKLNNISDIPAVDEQGYVYASVSNRTEIYGSGYDEPSGTIVAYYPNGTEYWTKRIDKPVSRPLADESFGQYAYSGLPMYRDRILYVPLKDGAMAIGMNGNTLWTREFDAGYYYPLPLMPVDADGNVFLEYHLDMNGGTYVKVINKAGHDLTTFNCFNADWRPVCGDPDEGRLYEDMPVYAGDTFTLENLTTYGIRAHDLVSGENDWIYTIPLYNKSSFVIDNGTVSVLDEYAHVSESSSGWSIVMAGAPDTTYTAPGVYPYYPLKMAVGKDAIYVSFFTANYEGPIVLGQSKCVYAGGIYALGKNGTLLWYKPTAAFASSVSGNNGTVYYATRNGTVGAGGIDAIAGGITIAALAYVLFRFFLVGAVARARDRLGKNENRNSVLKYVADNPGSTLREMSRGLKMNMGTLRYHMLILGLNHRVVSYMADDKHVRYFTNASTFTGEEQLIISLMRREGMGRLINAIREKPGSSNGELSVVLNMQESAVSRYLKELLEMGIVVKGRTPGGTVGFSIKDEYKGRITIASERISAKNR